MYRTKLNKETVLLQTNWRINCVLMRVMERRERDIVSFTAFHNPHQHTVDTPVCLPPRRRSQPSSLKSWHYTVLLQPLLNLRVIFFFDKKLSMEWQHSSHASKKRFIQHLQTVRQVTGDTFSTSNSFG